MVLTVPAGNKFVLASLLAMENNTDPMDNEFEGHFVDAVEIEVTAQTRGAIQDSE